jgi:hypothetical protein
MPLLVGAPHISRTGRAAFSIEAAKKAIISFFERLIESAIHGALHIGRKLVAHTLSDALRQHAEPHFERGIKCQVLIIFDFVSYGFVFDALNGVLSNKRPTILAMPPESGHLAINSGF